MTITVDVLEADASTVVAEVDAAHVVNASIEDPISGEGLGELVVGLESPDRAALEVKGRVLRWNGTGDEPFHSLIEDNAQVSLAESHSKVPRQITVRGRGLIAQWADVRVKQWPGMRHVPYYTRHFNYASPGKADEINGTAHEHGPVMAFDAYGQPLEPERPPPATWRAQTAQRIWSTPFSLSQPIATALMRKTITTDDLSLILRQHATADDRLLGWVGGVPVLKVPEYPEFIWGDTWPSDTLLLAETTYDVVFRCENEYFVEGGSAAWLGAAAWLLPTSGAPLTSDGLAYVSDDSWSALHLEGDPTPGWTPPEVLTVLCAEAQAENGLTGWEVVDATPEDWTPDPEVTFETLKTTGLGAVQQFADGQAEFATRVVDGVKQLLCFAPGSMGDYDTNGSPPTVAAGEYANLSFEWVQP